jgi:colanic acid/amylovoran biosynthesis glycosyltransferase
MIHYITPIGIGSAWVANEIATVEKHGVPIVLHSLRSSKQEFFSSDWARQLDAATNKIYPIAFVNGFVSILLAPFLFRGQFFQALFNALFGKRENFRNRLVAFVHFWVACIWARSLLGKDISLIHSQWIHSGGTVGMYGAWLLGVPFSFTGHAADLFRERVALEDKIRRAVFVVCISEFHRKFFLDLGARPEQLLIVYCGIDVTHFTPLLPARPIGQVPHIVSSGRLVEKKGFLYLLEACSVLAKRGVSFRCTIGGNGPQEAELRQKIVQLDLQDQVAVTGQPLTQEELPDFLRSADVYTLACVWAKDGDVDGLPQMLMEAMACGVPAVSTNLVGIPDLIVDGKTGRLVEPNDAIQLADALQDILKNPADGARMGAAGRQVILQKFEISQALAPLIQQFQHQLHIGAQAIKP